MKVYSFTHILFRFTLMMFKTFLLSGVKTSFPRFLGGFKKGFARFTGILMDLTVSLGRLNLKNSLIFVFFLEIQPGSNYRQRRRLVKAKKQTFSCCLPVCFSTNTM